MSSETDTATSHVQAAVPSFSCVWQVAREMGRKTVFANVLYSLSRGSQDWASVDAADLALNQRSRVIYPVSSMPSVADQGMRNEMLPLTAEPQCSKVRSFLAFLLRLECANDNEIKGFAPGRDRWPSTVGTVLTQIGSGSSTLAVARVG